MTRFGCNLRRIASLRRLSAGRGAPHAAGWPAAPSWPHPHRVRVVVAVGSGLMRVPESGVGSPFRSATSACLAVCLCRWCWWWVPESQVLRYRMVSGSVSSLCGGVSARRGLLGCLSFRYPAAATRRTEAHIKTPHAFKRSQSEASPRGYSAIQVTTAAAPCVKQISYLRYT